MPSNSLTEKQLEAWLMLSSTPFIGAKKLATLQKVDSLENIVQYSSQQLTHIGLNPKQVTHIKTTANREAERCLSWLQASNNRHIVTTSCGEYPPQLKEISAHPPLIFVKGKLSLLSTPQVAIVGSRNATLDGLRTANEFASDLAKKGLTITSGLALGIDGYAHDGALKATGDTIAVLGSGLEHIYPVQHRKLADRVAEQGALVSEFFPDVIPKAKHFPRRNRIISGLSLGVMIVEATQKSGSLITAKYAAEQNREVFALPGSIHNTYARGSNELIKQGACLIQSSDDIFSELHSVLTSSINKQKKNFVDEEDKQQLPFAELLANVGVEQAVPVDILVQRTHIPVDSIMRQLIDLELQGYIEAVSGGYIRTRRG